MKLIEKLTGFQFSFVWVSVFVVCLIGLLSGSSVLAQSSGRSPVKYIHAYGSTGVLFDLGVYYGRSEATANPTAGNTWQNSTSLYDIKFGYITTDSYYLGAEYTTRNDDQVTASNTSGSAAGVGLGYFFGNGFNLRAYYKFNESYGDYSQGSGYQADLGYAANMTSNFYLGFGVSFRQTSFKKNNTITNFDYWTRKETYPFISLGFLIN